MYNHTICAIVTSVNFYVLVLIDFLSDGDQLVVTTTISTGHPSHENTLSTQHSQKTKDPISTYSTGVTQEPHPASNGSNMHLL